MQIENGTYTKQWSIYMINVLKIYNRLYIKKKRHSVHTPDNVILDVLNNNVVNAEYAFQIHPPFRCFTIS